MHLNPIYANVYDLNYFKYIGPDISWPDQSLPHVPVRERNDTIRCDRHGLIYEDYPDENIGYIYE